MQANDVFRENVRSEMTRKGISAAAVARSAEIKPANMSRILGGTEAVTLTRAERIAIALGVPLSELLIEHPETATAELQHA